MARHASEPVLVPWRLGFSQQQLQLLQMDDDLIERAREAVGVHVLQETTEGREVLTIRGTMWQKRQAVRGMLERLFPNEGSLPLLLPSECFPALQAPELWEGLKLLGARLQLPERRDGPRFWAFAEGNREQMLSTATRVNTALQDLADHGRLVEGHFTEDTTRAPPQVLQMPQQLLHPQKLQEQTQRMLQERVQKQLEELQRRSDGPASPPHGILKKREVAPDVSAEALGQKAIPGSPDEPGKPLRLLMSRKQLEFLIPDHFAAVAKNCSVHLDVEGLRPGQEKGQVLLSGNLVALGMALVQLQMRAAQCL